MRLSTRGRGNRCENIFPVLPERNLQNSQGRTPMVAGKAALLSLHRRMNVPARGALVEGPVGASVASRESSRPTTLARCGRGHRVGANPLSSCLRSAEAPGRVCVQWVGRPRSRGKYSRSPEPRRSSAILFHTCFARYPRVSEWARRLDKSPAVRGLVAVDGGTTLAGRSILKRDAPRNRQWYIPAITRTVSSSSCGCWRSSLRKVLGRVAAWRSLSPERGDEGRAPTAVLGPGRGLFRLELLPIFTHREVLYFLVWRDVKVRYRQTVFGVGWAVLQPLAAVLIFSVVFGRLAGIPSDGLPYPVFAYAGLLPWSFFSQALTRCSGSLVGEAHLITKVYFPRLIVPLAAMVRPALDTLFSFAAFVALMLWFGIRPTWGIVLLPLFLLFAFVAALAIGLWLAPTNVRYRDVSLAVPFLTQVGMYLSPVVYPVSLVPKEWRAVYVLNPMAGVIEGFRWALLGKPGLDPWMVAGGVAITLVILLGGLIYFRRMERSFADLV